MKNKMSTVSCACAYQNAPNLLPENVKLRDLETPCKIKTLKQRTVLLENSNDHHTEKKHTAVVKFTLNA